MQHRQSCARDLIGEQPTAHKFPGGGGHSAQESNIHLAPIAENFFYESDRIATEDHSPLYTPVSQDSLNPFKE